MSVAPPLIVTLAMDDASFARLDGLRQRHFPAERNFIPAHVTLFHHLPGSELSAIRLRLEAIGNSTRTFTVEAAGLQFLGRGVAIRLASPDLLALRARLKDSWESWLTSQDQQPWRPHVTIQNKVEPADARQLHAELGQTFRPFPIVARGILLWRYEGGPWASLADIPFAGA